MNLEPPLMDAVVYRLMFSLSKSSAALKNTFRVQRLHVRVLFQPRVHFGLAFPFITRSSDVGEVVSVPSFLR